MKNIKTFESFSTKIRAGLIPYIKQDGIIKMLFFIPSDPAYGGDKPQIAKGRVDRNEDIKTAALREASEELGLVLDNVINTKLITKDLLSGMTADNYEFHLFASEIKDLNNFSEYGDETMETKWLTIEEFISQGRESQVELVKKTYDIIK
jgi:8-oxo-dGTP pyrophosphatase MutT (NUDIX family)